MDSIELLDRLVGFDTVSDRSNLELVTFVCSYLSSHGVETKVFPDPSGRKASIFATIGPQDRSGIILSGHTDVVPVDGQEWSSDPFALCERDGRFYGRGTADMKGFVASAINAMSRASRRQLDTPLHLALSYDEEIGCVGVRPLLDILASKIPTPRLCLVGEPTSLTVAVGHKGKVAATIRCRGVAAHSSTAPMALNALHLAADALGVLRLTQKRLQSVGGQDLDYDVPYTTVHAGLMQGGTALNIVPDEAIIEFEIRTIDGEDAEAIVRDIEKELAEIVATQRSAFPSAAIEVTVNNSYPGLSASKSGFAAEFVGSLFSGPSFRKVAFGTEAGLFQKMLCPEVVVCGPGAMQQGHRPDEFIERNQIGACDRMMDNLIDRLV